MVTKPFLMGEGWLLTLVVQKNVVDLRLWASRGTGMFYSCFFGCFCIMWRSPTSKTKWREVWPSLSLQTSLLGPRASEHPAQAKPPAYCSHREWQKNCPFCHPTKSWNTIVVLTWSVPFLFCFGNKYIADTRSYFKLLCIFLSSLLKT